MRKFRTLLLFALAGCADNASESNANTPTIAERAPQRLASICDNADAVGCTLGPIVGALPRADGSTIVAHHGGPLFRFDSVDIVDVRSFRVAWMPPVGVSGRNEPIPFEIALEDVQLSERGSFLLAVPGTDTAGAHSLPLDRIELADLQRVAWGRNDSVRDARARREMDANPNRTHPTVTRMACDDAVIIMVTSSNATRSRQRWRVIDWNRQELVRLQLPVDAKLSMVAHGRFTVLRSNDESGAEWVETYALPTDGF